jgi:preprotein translocase subunit SecE
MADKANSKDIAGKGRILAKKTTRFFKEVVSELKKVVWLTKKQLIQNVVAVLAVSLFFGIIIWIADFGFSKIL